MQQWPNPTETDELNSLFGFSATGEEQDWEIEFADPNRINEFYSAYINAKLSDSKKMAVMSLVLASFDELIALNRDNIDLWGEISSKLIQDITIHKYTIEYWCCENETEPDHIFDLTPRIREIANGL